MKSLALLLFSAASVFAGSFVGSPSIPVAGASFVQGARVADVDIAYDGLSGLARPNIYENRGYLWMVSDNVDNANLVVLNIATGAIAGEWTVTGSSRVDWEDLGSAKIGGVPYLYIFDFGNNTGTNNDSRGTNISLRIWRAVEPTITGSNGTIAGGDVIGIDCDFPVTNGPSDTAGGRDCEAGFVDPETGTMYFVRKRYVAGRTALDIYSLAHAASYAGTQTLVFEGQLCADTSNTNNVAIGTGTKTIAQVSQLPYPVGMTVRCIDANNAAQFMEGPVISSGANLTIDSILTASTATPTNWVITIGTSTTPPAQNGGITGAGISPDGCEIFLTSYGQNAVGASGVGGTNLYRFTRNKRTQTIAQALAQPPQMMLSSYGGGTNYPHSNPPSGPQIETISYDYSGTNLYSVGEYYSTYGATTRPLVKFSKLSKPVKTLVLQSGLNGYTAYEDTFLQSESPTANNSAAASNIADFDPSATTDTISTIVTAGGGSQILVSTNALTGITAGRNVAIWNSSVAAYNGTWIVASTGVLQCTLNRAYVGDATGGSIRGHTGANGDRQILMRWSDLSAIPAGSTIVGARVNLYVNTEGEGWNFHRMLQTWEDTSTWTSLTDGITANDTEAAYTPSAIIFPSAPATYVGFYMTHVPISTIQGWLDGTMSNFGWAMLHTDGATATTNGQQIDSDNSATQARKPMLIIRYTAP